MPINREDFDRDRVDSSSTVYDLLSGSPSLAFTLEEVRKLLLEGGAAEAALEGVEGELDRLVSQGLAGSREMGGQRWYVVVRSRRGSLRV